jgi:hypothetical protein
MATVLTDEAIGRVQALTIGLQGAINTLPVGDSYVKEWSPVMESDQGYMSNEDDDCTLVDIRE